MKRRIEDIGSRPEATAAGIVSGGQLGGVGGAGGYVRVPPTAPTIAVGTTIPGGVATVPAPSIGSSIVHTTVHTIHEHPHPQSGYNSGKVHHTIPSYTTNLSSGNPQGGMGGVETGRPVVGTPIPGNLMSGSPSQAVSQGPPASHSPHPVLQHGNNSASSVRQRTGSNNVIASIGAGAATMAACAAVAGNNQVTGQFQRLKVEDALSYLDQVKLRFGREPQVYNDFLDIMKEFKSQSIDTPGVIARVSQLFRGHPELIVGFNTFLPPGYKIEVSVVTGQQTTVVHTPQGIHHHVTPTPPSQGALSPSVTVKSTSSPHGIHPPNAPRPSPMPPVNQHSGPGAPSPAPSGTPSPLMPNSVMGLSTSPSLTVNANPSQGLCPTVAPVGVPQVGVGMAVQQPSSTLSNCLVGGASSVSGTNSLGSGSGAAQLQPHNRESTPQPPAPSVPSIHHMHQHQPAAQPVEFNHAINYVNKIKLRFQGQPDIYKQFLEILHTYQKEQKHIKEGGVMPTRTLTEAEVYEKVAKLFENQEDLLQEFGQFLPDATNNTATQAAVSNFMDQCRSHNTSTKPLANDHTVKKPNLKSSCNVQANNNIHPSSGGPAPGPTIGVPPPLPPNNANVSIYGAHGLKRPFSSSGAQTVSAGGQHPPHPPVKKPKLSYLKDMSAAEAGKFATLSEYAFFDRVRKALRHEETYCNFLRCITLFNEEIISRAELVQVVHPFLSKFPELLKWFKDFIGYRDGTSAPPTDLIPVSVAKQERISGDLAMEIDYTTCKRLGASYCALPKTYPQPQCSGRNKNSLCKEVLNDTWVSFPSWSEDSTFVTSRKTQYEEYIYRCEDERFELDVVLETNLATMRVLEAVQKKLQRMSPEEAARFRLDDSIGGSSPTISQRAIKRIYGEKAPDIIDGLKKNPVVAVPLVLRRLKAKDEEWREAQKGFNKVWREQNERYYLKSLDHQGLTFKQNDIKTLRSKSLLNDIETLYDERHEQAEDGGELVVGPHMVLPYKDKTPLDDAANLIIHHVRRQTTIHKEDKAKIKQLVRHFIPDLFFHPRMELSDDENVEEDADDDYNSKSESKNSSVKNERNSSKEAAAPPNAVVVSPPSSSPGGSAPVSSSEGFSSPTAAPSNGTKRKTRSNKYPAENTDKDSKEHENVTSSSTTTTSSSSLPGTTTTTSGTGLSNSVPSTIKGDRVTVNGDASDSFGGVVKTEPESDSESPQVKKEPQDEGAKQQIFSVASSSLTDDEYRLFFGNNNWFIFLRLHHILCQRLSIMYEHAVRIAADEVKDKRDRRDSTAVALRLKPKNEIAVEDYYPALLDMVQNMLDGNLESTAFEDTLRDMFGIYAYTAFTLDKVVNGAVRQLQHIVCDDVPSQCTSQYLQEARRGGAGGPIASIHRRLHMEQTYQKRTEKLLQDENCFKVFTYKRDSRITVELIDTDMEESEEQQNGTTTTTTPATTVTSVSTTTSSIPSTVTTSTSISNSNNNNNTSTTTASTNGGQPENGAKGEVPVSPHALFVHPFIPPAVVEVERWSEYVEKYVTTVSPQVSPAMQAQLCRKPVFLPRNLRAWKREISGRKSSQKQGNVVKSEAHGMEIMDNTQCKFNLSNKIVFVANSVSYVFKREALRRAKESHEAVSKRKKRGFSNWHETWSSKHVSESEATRTENWFMGEIEGLRPNKTRKKRVERLRHPPYLPFNKYECEIIQENSSS